MQLYSVYYLGFLKTARTMIELLVQLVSRQYHNKSLGAMNLEQVGNTINKGTHTAPTVNTISIRFPSAPLQANCIFACVHV